MYYHLSVKNAKQLSSLKGKFRNLCEDENCYIFMINQSPQQFDFIAVTVLVAEVLEDPGYKLRHNLDHCLYSLIQDHVLREDFSFMEIDQPMFINKLALSVEFHRDITDICSMAVQFDLSLEEVSSRQELLNVEHNQEFLKLKELIQELDLTPNLFLVNLKSKTDKDYAIAELTKMLIDQHQVISTDYVQLRFNPEALTGLIEMATDSRFLHTISGKLLLIPLDYLALAFEDPDDFDRLIITPLKHLCVHVAVVVSLDKVVTNRLAKNLSRQLCSTLITEG